MAKKVRVFIDYKYFSFKVESVKLIIIRPGGAIVQIGDKVLGYVGKRDKEKLEEYRNSRKLLDWITNKPKESELSKLKLLAKELWEEIEAYKRNSRS